MSARDRSDLFDTCRRGARAGRLRPGGSPPATRIRQPNSPEMRQSPTAVWEFSPAKSSAKLVSRVKMGEMCCFRWLHHFRIGEARVGGSSVVTVPLGAWLPGQDRHRPACRAGVSESSIEWPL